MTDIVSAKGHSEEEAQRNIDQQSESGGGNESPKHPTSPTVVAATVPNCKSSEESCLEGAMVATAPAEFGPMKSTPSSPMLSSSRPRRPSSSSGCTAAATDDSGRPGSRPGSSFVATTTTTLDVSLRKISGGGGGGVSAAAAAAALWHPHVYDPPPKTPTPFSIEDILKGGGSVREVSAAARKMKNLYEHLGSLQFGFSGGSSGDESSPRVTTPSVDQLGEGQQQTLPVLGSTGGAASSPPPPPPPPSAASDDQPLNLTTKRSSESEDELLRAKGNNCMKMSMVCQKLQCACQIGNEREKDISWHL